MAKEVSRRKFIGVTAGTGLAVGAGMVVPWAFDVSPGLAFVQSLDTSKLPYRITQAQREAAAERAKAMRKSVELLQPKNSNPGVLAAEITTPQGPGGIPDYFGTTPNWAYSPLVRKFVDRLPGVGAANANLLGNYIGVAHPDTVTYQGCDYYEIELREYQQKLHSDLPPTRLRGYVQVNNGTDAGGANTVTPDPIGYLGPFIQATKDRPVRIKFTNKLPVRTNPDAAVRSEGDLFIPVDVSVMGAGMGPDGMEGYTQNRAELHLHGGVTPWISDGTPHQWITPAGEDTSLPRGASARNVPDMSDPGDGSVTLYYTNQQNARLMWIHDHSYGITRLNVYAGEVMAYLLTDAIEQALITAGTIPSDQIPLVIQDKTFVDATTIPLTDPTWNWGTTAPVPHTGDLWMPHVYVPAQNPADPGGMNATGRWHYGPWFWPPATNVNFPPIPNPYWDPLGTTPWENPTMPATPNPSMGMEAFHDTPLINGVPYPVLNVNPKAYRFRILNGASDRFFNLQMYVADPAVTSIDGRANTEVKMVPALATAGFPELWPTDGREGGVPDPATAGPEWIQIGTESGFLPTPAIVPQQPISWNLDQTTFNFGNIQNHSLMLAPAERADVIVDFSAYAGRTLILYNDAPTAFPALDPRTDYYTGAPDMTSTGGTTTPQAGFGPNTRTVMQINVAAVAPAPAYNRAPLMAAFATTGTQDGVFKAGQHPIIVPDARYNSAYNGNFVADPYVRISQTTMSITPLDGSAVIPAKPLEPKAIQDEMGETYDPDYGRMSGKFGLERTSTNSTNQNFVLCGYIDPPTEILTDNVTPAALVSGAATQVWKITHNGVDTHPVHFHLNDVQLINRVGWDGAVRAPEDNELGWKETVRVSPLEDTIVAMRPVAPKLPFGVPDSIRLLDPTMPAGVAGNFSLIDPHTGQPFVTPVTNVEYNFGWEYVFHCHILSHEEMDMMRPLQVMVASAIPRTPTSLAAAGTPGSGGGIALTWTDTKPAPVLPLTLTSTPDPQLEVGFRIERAPLTGGTPGAYTAIATAPANSAAYTDLTTIAGADYRYRIVAFNAAGDSAASNTSDAVSAVDFASYIVTPTAGPNGTIAPNTPQGVPVGSPSNVTFTFTPSTGHHIAAVVVDGTPVASPTATYTFTAVAANHTIDVTFAVNQFAITPTAGANGTIWWDTPQLVQYGAMKTFAFLPATGYRVANVLVDGVSVGQPTYYTFSNVVATHTISVTFEVMTYTITPTASAGGTITPSTPQTLAHGASSPAFTMTASAGFHLSAVAVDGVLVVPTPTTYTFTNVTANHTIDATFVSDRMMPVFRFYNVKNGDHFYTASVAERDAIVVNWPTVFTYEGIAYSVNLDNPANNTPLYRFYNHVRDTHFFTASAAEKDMVIATWPTIFTFEGVAYNVSATAAANTTAVYRFYNVQNGGHFYTISVAERDTVIATWPNIYTYEGVVFYIGY
ncbi:MAG: multicopper oxidase domain-containing protein [Coriobacteriia bacterium]|nr:multicopper oxidase domain-containing protein [Coriobacteriia bacterium]